jgi:hypothetical protein
MRRYGGWGGAAVCAALVCFTGSARADETELRHFAILVDGKRAGDYQMSIIKRADGTTLMGGVASVRVRVLIKTYTYTYRGMELWKNGRLQRLDSSSNDDGKQFTVAAVPQGNQLQVTVNDQVHATRTDVWTTTYWHLPDARFRNQGVPLLDADTGRDLGGVLRQVGTSPIQINGEVVQCAHWHLAGGKTADLWYDNQERLVREETIEDGYRTILELVSVNR